VREFIERIKTPRSEECAHFRLKQAIVTQHGGGTRKRRLVACAILGQPVAHAADRLLWIVGVNFDVLAADVLKGGIITMRLGFQNQGALASVSTGSEKSGSEVKAKLHRHIETR
jgi:hypothetical protein